MKTWLKCCTALLITFPLVLLGSVQAQDSDDGRGVVTFASGSYYGEASTLFPNTCGTRLCAMLHTLLYPRLFDFDPATGALLDASQSSRALVQAIPQDLPADEVQLALSPDRLWSDGEPVTAYDVLFSLLAYTELSGHPYAAALRELAGVRLVDEHTIALRFAATDEEIAELPPDADPPTATCDDLPRSNVFILPSHYLSPSFRAFVDQIAVESLSLSAWRRAYRDAGLSSPSAVPEEPVTSGSYLWAGLDSDLSARFTPADGTGSALKQTLNYSASSVLPADSSAFIAGDLDLLLTVPIDQRPELRALAQPDTRNVQLGEVPGNISLVILMNFGSPQRPLPGIHPETGEVIDQGQHPIFSDINVRRALQIAIDQGELIDGVFQRSARKLSGLFPPASWAYDSSLTLPESDLTAANRLLDDAGWADWDGDGVRQCVRCQTAPLGTPLSFTLGTFDVYYPVADEIIERWRQIGVSAGSGDFSGSLESQTFDAYLLQIGGQPRDDADPDHRLMLTPAGDRFTSPFAGFNYGSYNNPEVTRLIEEARTVPGCDPAARADLYHQLERVLQGDLPFLSVAAPDEFYAAAPNVLGFSPRSGDPLWNIESWVVSP